MKMTKHQAGADYIRLVLEKTGLKGKQLAEKAGFKAPSTINRPISDNPGDDPPSVRTLLRIRNVSGVPFPAYLLETYPELQVVSGNEKARIAGGMPDVPRRSTITAPAEPVEVDVIKAFPLRDETVLVQFWDGSGPTFQVKVPLAEMLRLRAEMQDW